MSASLVGSEMCIRDRWAEWPLPRLGIGERRRRPRFQCWAPEALRFAPVSYTHLTLPTICSV
eukprot:3634546-Alexandrium_andersonii.AAC.1